MFKSVPRVSEIQLDLVDPAQHGSSHPPAQLGEPEEVAFLCIHDKVKLCLRKEKEGKQNKNCSEILDEAHLLLFPYFLVLFQ